MNRKTWAWVFCGALLALSLFLALPAQADDDDPPSRVARMNYAQGSVSFQPGGEGDWVEAVPNRPLTTGDNLWADKNARAELHVGSTAIYLGGETSVTFLELNDRTLQLRLASGTLMLRVRHFDDDDAVEVDTPNLAFRVQRNGEYRVNVDADGHTSVIDVFTGRGEAIGGGNNYTIVANQQARFGGDEQLSYDIDQLPAPDGFDDWAFDRDRHEDRSESANYVSREMTGYEDLDDYGRWSYEGNYGPVWVPTGMAVGWAPYRYGHWVWVAPWGWTWVDDQPWGFAPFHYGRWCRVREGWGWVPGPVVVRPVYAPALVAFVGGGGFGLSVFAGGGGGVAWFPLGPGEVFVPAYHVSRGYVNQVNVTNTVVNVTKVTNVYNYYTVHNNTNITRVTYINQTAPNAMTAVSRETFVNARPVGRNTVQVSQREIEQAPVTHDIAVAPVRSSVMGSGRPTTFAPPRAIAARQVQAQRAPSQPPVPFNQRQDKLVTRPAQPMPGAGSPRNENMNPSPNQPAPRPEWQAPRPSGQSSTPPQPAVRPATPRAENPTPVSPRVETPRPEAPRVAEPRPNMNGNSSESRPEQGWSHPLAKPAAPVQPKSERQAQDEEQKYHQWQQQREKAAPPPRPAPKPEPKRDEKPHGSKDR